MILGRAEGKYRNTYPRRTIYLTNLEVPYM